MANFTPMFLNFMFAGLLVFSVLAFGSLYQDENAVQDPFIEDDALSDTYSGLSSSLGGFRDQAQEQKQLFETENPTTGTGSILLFSIVSAGKIFGSMVITLFNTLIALPVTILGIDPIVVSVLVSIIILTLIVGLWRIYKLGG